MFIAPIASEHFCQIYVTRPIWLSSGSTIAFSKIRILEQVGEMITTYTEYNKKYTLNLQFKNPINNILNYAFALFYNFP